MAGRKLVSVRRRIDSADSARYEELWTQLVAAVRERGAHAWRFRSELDDAFFIEFLEFGAGADPRQSPAVSGALEALDGMGAGMLEGWIDAEDMSEGDER